MNKTTTLIVLFLSMSFATFAQNVGIGTATPATANKLHVHSGLAGADASIGITNSLTTDAVLRGARLRVLNSDFRIFNYEATGSIIFSTNFFDRMAINSIGNVGIGTNSIDVNAMLHIKLPSSGSFPKLLLESPDVTTGFGIQFKNPSGYWSLGANVGNYDDNRFNLFYNGGSVLQTLTMSATGNFGIGDFTGLGNLPTERLEIKDGFIKSSGSVNNKTAFTITATAANSSAHILNLSYINQSQSDIVIVTHNYNPPGVVASYHNFNVGVFWDSSKWTIYNENTTAPILGKSFNVLVIKQ